VNSHCQLRQRLHSKSCAFVITCLLPQGWGHRIDCGDVDQVLADSCDFTLEGDAKVGGQVRQSSPCEKGTLLHPYRVQDRMP